MGSSGVAVRPPDEKIPLSICSGGFFHLAANGENLPGCPGLAVEILLPQW